MSDSLAQQIKRFDAYPKTLKDFRVQTLGGAFVTGVSSVIMLILFISEFHYYATTEVETELFVDTTRHQKLRINMDVFFPKLGCAYITIDAVDVSGEQQSDIQHNLFKKRYNEHGQPVDSDAKKGDLGDKSAEALNALNQTKTEDPNECQSCYGAETKENPCCNSCEDIKNAYRKKGWATHDLEHIEQCKGEHWKDAFQEQRTEGCQVYGFIEVSKVAGKFYIAPLRHFHQQHMHVQFITIGKDGKISMSFNDLAGMGQNKFNVTHNIKSLSFGVPVPGVENPLDGTDVSAQSDSMMYQYFVKVVPTVYRKLSGQVVWTNQYSFTKHVRLIEHFVGESNIPGFYVSYELSPMLIQYTEKRRSFMHFVTGVCAIIGGIFTVAGLVDSMIYHSAKALKKKVDLGKAT